MTTRSPTIVGVSDVSVGYGSPQIPTLLRSLLRRYPSARACLIEPDQSDRPPRPELFPDMDVLRVPTRFDCFSPTGIIEYNVEVARHLTRLRPDLLVFTCPQVLPALGKTRARPKTTIYYMLEPLSFYAEAYGLLGRCVLDLHRRLAPRFDLLVFPEENRAASDVQRAGLKDVPLVVAYNAVNPARAAEDVLPPTERRRRLLYAGTIRRGVTFPEYFLRDEVRHIPIDLYGAIPEEDLRAALLAAGSIDYKGHVDARTLDAVRRQYAFSIVMWAPTNEHQLYACPNKFFEAIADGVPPIAAPHPQCKMLIERYRCGIVMDDWSFDGFRAAVEKAMGIFGTDEYAEMIEHCRQATAQELNWENQFAKIERYLPEEL